jgi:hypothetical protein
MILQNIDTYLLNYMVSCTMRQYSYISERDISLKKFRKLFSLLFVSVLINDNSILRLYRMYQEESVILFENIP